MADHFLKHRMTENYYTILEISRDASDDEIKKSYRKLALKYHPDRNPSGDKFFENRFKEIVDAYHVLSDKNRRTIYDYDLTQRLRKPRSVSGNSSRRPAETTAAPSNDKEPVTHQSVIKQLIRIRKKIEAVKNKQAIKHNELFKALNTQLTTGNIELVRSAADTIISRRAIDEVLFCCRYLSTEYLDRITAKLIKIAGPDNEKILEIHQFIRKRKQIAVLYKYMPAITISAIIILVFIILNLL